MKQSSTNQNWYTFRLVQIEPRATPKPRLIVSPHAALQYEGHCHQHHLPCTSSWQWACANAWLVYRLFVQLPFLRLRSGQAPGLLSLLTFPALAFQRLS